MLPAVAPSWHAWLAKMRHVSHGRQRYRQLYQSMVAGVHNIETLLHHKIQPNNIQITDKNMQKWRIKKVAR